MKRCHIDIIDKLALTVLPGRERERIREIVHFINMFRAHAPEVRCGIVRSKHEITRRSWDIRVETAPDHPRWKVSAVIRMQMAERQACIARVQVFLQRRKGSRA